MKDDSTISKMFSKPAYLVPAIILGWLLIFIVYYAFDKVGLEITTANAVVTAKTRTPGSTSFVNRLTGGRLWSQAQKQPDFYAVSLSIDGEPTVALVAEATFGRLKINQNVQISFRRTRISGKILVLNVQQ